MKNLSTVWARGDTNSLKIKDFLESYFFSVPHAELEAEKARLAELIESLHRENNELHQILSTFFQDAG